MEFNFSFLGVTNLSFSDFRDSWSVGVPQFIGGSDPGQTNISLSSFRGARFRDDTEIPDTGEISVNTHFKGKNFGAIKFKTKDFKAYNDWSAHTSLIGTTGSSTFTGSTTANKRVQLNGTGQSSSYPYPILLLNPQYSASNAPGIIVDRSSSYYINEATLWFRVIGHSSYNQVQFGILAKDMTTNNWSSQKSNIGNKHATYCDRLGSHGGGYHNYAGSRDDITSSSNIVLPQYKSGTYNSKLTTIFHTRTGTTAGTQRSNNALSAPTLGTNVYFFTNNLFNYSGYRSNTLYPSHGLKIKWYEKTLNVSLESGSNIIRPTSGKWSSSDLDGIFSGMYISGTGINSNDGAFIANIHTNYMLMYKSKGLSSTSLNNSNATSNQSSVTLTISGYLYWTLVTSPESSSTSNASYTDAKIIGPPHQVLPKYQAGTSTSAPTNEIKEWAFYIGDTTSGTTNTFSYDLRNEEPGGIPFSYSASYTSGTIPTTAAGVYISDYHIHYGNAGSSKQTVTYDLSTFNYVGTSVIGHSGKFVFKYISGSSFRGDIQLVRLTYNGNISISLGSEYTNWKRNYYVNPSSYPSDSEFMTVENSSTNGRWSRQSGGTSSGSTGVYLSDPYIYFEASGNGIGHPNKTSYLKRDTPVAFTSNSVTLEYYAYGSNIGHLYAGVELVVSNSNKK